ncbi:endonuclease/exonuclease/phosphatase family protein [Massilia arenosa]|uniref:Endonuclease/exonuclease/phosphatase family protein n=1 Tax=Zemynaea arenosa TaxID=2561931 RepID=A0A4Y9SJW8_9BURK|nr:endonuclease/exonuclease/phosphatase family protein [Massilia arenosa]TFW26590.1 endonuclease/exonuclease/phosphatase family protein [Massilia arenosa]
MQEEIRFATFNVCNLAHPGRRLYDNLDPYTAEQVEAKIAWTARQLDLIDADIIGFQEIFSQSALQEALSRTTRFRDAFHVGFDPDPALDKLTPSVALVSRLPLAEPGRSYAQFPPGVALPHGARDADRFARPVVHAVVQATPSVKIDVVVVHLKSKRPDFQARSTDPTVGEDTQEYAQACLRSLVRRGTEAVALRVLLSNLRREYHRPRVVLGDFNDTADAVTTDIVLGSGAPQGDRFYDAFRLQPQAARNAAADFSMLHEGQFSTIDHILLSEEFNPVLAGTPKVGEVVEVRYFNEHLSAAVPEASDHGQVLARIRLFS